MPSTHAFDRVRASLRFLAKRSATVKLPAWWFVLISTFMGIALSLKNAPGTPTTEHAIALVLGCTGLAFVWGCVLAWAMCRDAKPLAPVASQIDSLVLGRNQTHAFKRKEDQ